MKAAAGGDHAGYPLKPRVIEELHPARDEIIDLRTDSTDPMESPDSACAAGRAERGVLIFGSGAGGAANQFLGIGAALCHDSFSARRSVGGREVNILRPAARVIGRELAVELVRGCTNRRISRSRRRSAAPRQNRGVPSRIR